MRTDFVVRAPSSVMIETRALTKSFGFRPVLKGVNLEVQPGECVVMLGPNGAGKTTFVSAVATLLRPDAGELRVAGIDVVRDPRRVRQIIGLAGQFASVEPAMTGRENLQLVARLFGLDRRAARAATDDVLDRLGLADAGDRLVRTYSGGMRRRLDLGASLVGRPRLLLLDEPTTGLDPRSKLEVQAFVEELRDTHAATIVLTTHDMAEAERLCDRIGIIDAGRIVVEDTPEGLRALVNTDHGQPPTMEDVFMTYTGKSLDEDIDEDEKDDEED